MEKDNIWLLEYDHYRSLFEDDEQRLALYTF